MSTLADGVRAGRVRAVAKAITVIDEGGPEAADLLTALWRGASAATDDAGDAADVAAGCAAAGAASAAAAAGGAARGDPLSESVRVIGITGAPGAGKSTLTDLLIERYRQQGLRVSVLAVDPSSPFTGGAVLGDRVRMNRHALDAGCFIRSLGARGALGGLARPARGAIRVLAAAGFDVILLETVGVGQSELDVMHVADTVALVLTPAGGDQVQATKSGIMEIADLYVINKADLPGSARLRHAIADMLHVRAPDVASGGDLAGGVLGATSEGVASGTSEGQWVPPVLEVSASRAEGVEAMAAAVAAHGDYLRETGQLAQRRSRQRLQELRERFRESLCLKADRALVEEPALMAIAEAVLERRVAVEVGVEQLVALWEPRKAGS
ncbi:MAG: methylmalonyl Co-A mutase-associated GTPase MeaB [Firmicutes bacterium]|nr:methylmalonyl Co-A mutase-associated GTPase MeaB [Bacillota bacterium]